MVPRLIHTDNCCECTNLSLRNYSNNTYGIQKSGTKSNLLWMVLEEMPGEGINKTATDEHAVYSISLMNTHPMNYSSLED